jgi:hypothetical protein
MLAIILIIILIIVLMGAILNWVLTERETAQQVVADGLLAEQLQAEELQREREAMRVRFRGVCEAARADEWRRQQQHNREAGRLRAERAVRPQRAAGLASWR